MKSKYIAEIRNNLENKIKLLNEYEQITAKMVDADLEKITELIAQRQLLIKDIDKITSEINEIVDNQHKGLKTCLTEILSFEKIECDDALEGIKVLAEKLESILIEISHKEKDVVLRMDDLKKALELEMLQSNKGKQVMDYCNSFASFNFNGNKFNSIS